MDDEIKKRRLSAIKLYWENHRDQIHFHIPDLYSVDPLAHEIDPLIVPSTFIPEPVGGTIDVYQRAGSRIDSEPTDFILMNFLPGGYKKRWWFRMYRGL